MKFILDVDTGPIEVLSIGPDSAETVVFLHHGFGTVDSMGAVMDAFAQQRPDLRLVSYSRPGCGRTPVRKVGKALDYLHVEAQQVLPEFLTGMALGPVHLVGHSDGGSISLIAAATRPELVRSVTAIAPHSMIEDQTLAGLRDLATMRDNIVFRTALARRHDNVTEAFDAWLDLWLSPQMITWSILDLLGDIKCPLGLIQGTDDAFGTTAQVDVVVKAVAPSRLKAQLVSGATHDLYKDYPDQVLKMWQSIQHLPHA
ncbi:alpha/beta hydrolase [Roseovarius aestuarii]|nr:alpha/beta hydrolase [Roseovarius aestuarii]